MRTHSKELSPPPAAVAESMLHYSSRHGSLLEDKIRTIPLTPRRKNEMSRIISISSYLPNSPRARVSTKRTTLFFSLSHFNKKTFRLYFYTSWKRGLPVLYSTSRGRKQSVESHHVLLYRPVVADFLSFFNVCCCSSGVILWNKMAYGFFFELLYTPTTFWGDNCPF